MVKIDWIVVVTKWISFIICCLFHYFLCLMLRRPSESWINLIERTSLVCLIYPFLWWIIAERILRYLKRILKP